jgi:signal transduction histidine kinase
MLQMTEIDLRDVVERAATCCSGLIGEDILPETRLGSEPVMVRADLTAADQVVINLAVNAREAMPNGGTLLDRSSTATAATRCWSPTPASVWTRSDRRAHL